MADENQSVEVIENAPEPTAGEVAVDLATNPGVDAWDSVMDRAGIKDDAEGSDAGTDPDADDDAADAGGAEGMTADAGDAEIEAGIAELARMPGMTSDRAKRLLAADPDLVREYGREAMARTPEAPADPAAPEKPAEAPAAPAAPDTTLAEILGETLDKEEAAVVIRAFEHHRAAVLAEVKKLVPDVGGIDKRLAGYDAAVSELYGRRVVDEMSSDFPELKAKGAYEQVHKKAVAMRQSGVQAPVRELIEMAVISLHGGKARAEVREHKSKIARAKTAGTPSTPKVGDPADNLSQYDRDFDRAWDKAQKR